MKKGAELLQNKKNWLGLFFVLPAILNVLIFVYYPVVRAFMMAFYEYDIVRQSGDFIGLDHFKSLANRDLYWFAWSNTLILFVYSIIFGFWVPIVQAILLSQIRKYQKMFRLLYILPAIVPGIAGLLMWKWIFDPNVGFLNKILDVFGLGPYGWLYDAGMSKFSLGLMGIVGGGFSVLIYLATIQGISQEQFESAEIDGATGFKKISKIILPQMRNIIMIQLVFGIIGALQAFNTQFIMTDGGPADSTLVINLLIFNTGFGKGGLNYGLASAMAITMFVVIIILTMIQVNVQQKLED